MGLFSKLFGGSPPPPPPADLSSLVCDVHSHFIPGIDDGAPTLEASIELITAMHDLGYRKVVTTPHVMADGYRNTPEVILGGLEVVRRELQARQIDMRIDAAAEYYLDHELEQRVKAREVLTFGDRLVLFELPFISEPAILRNVVFEMQTLDYRPVLAHPERYQFWYTEWNKYEDLKDRGVLFQLNIPALIGAYGPMAKKIAERLIDAGYYELVGSDCHRMDHVEAIKAARTEPYLHKLLASGKLLNATL